jgi:hypothetical protein
MPMAVAEVGRRGRAQRTMPHELKRPIRPGLPPVVRSGPWSTPSSGSRRFWSRTYAVVVGGAIVFFLFPKQGASGACSPNITMQTPCRHDTKGAVST